MLLYDPTSVLGFHGKFRGPIYEEEPLAEDGTGGLARNIPSKWKFKWTGPHIIVRRKSDNVYIIHNTFRNQEEPVNVDRLVRYYPFANHPDLELRRAKKAWRGDAVAPVENTKMDKDEPHRKEKGPQPGDMVIVYLPQKNPFLGPQPLCVGRYLCDDDTVPGAIQVQWFSSLQGALSGQENSTKKRFLPGWIDHKNLHYWKRAPLYYKDTPFTNFNMDATVSKEDVLMWAFDLNHDGRLPKLVAQRAWNLLGQKLQQ